MAGNTVFGNTLYEFRNLEGVCLENRLFCDRMIADNLKGYGYKNESAYSILQYG